MVVRLTTGKGTKVSTKDCGKHAGRGLVAQVSSSKEVKVRCSTCNVKNSSFDGKKLQLESKGKNLQRRPLHNKYVSCRLAALVKKAPLFSSAYCCFPEYCWVNISNLDITLFRNSLQYEIPFSPYYAMFKPHRKIQNKFRKVLF